MPAQNFYEYLAQMMGLPQAPVAHHQNVQGIPDINSMMQGYGTSVADTQLPLGPLAAGGMNPEDRQRAMIPPASEVAEDQALQKVALADIGNLQAGQGGFVTGLSEGTLANIQRTPQGWNIQGAGPYQASQERVFQGESAPPGQLQEIQSAMGIPELPQSMPMPQPAPPGEGGMQIGRTNHAAMQIMRDTEIKLAQREGITDAQKQAVRAKIVEKLVGVDPSRFKTPEMALKYIQEGTMPLSREELLELKKAQEEMKANVDLYQKMIQSGFDIEKTKLEQGLMGERQKDVATHKAELDAKEKEAANRRTAQQTVARMDLQAKYRNIDEAFDSLMKQGPEAVKRTFKNYPDLVQGGMFAKKTVDPVALRQILEGIYMGSPMGGMALPAMPTSGNEYDDMAALATQ